MWEELRYAIRTGKIGDGTTTASESRRVKGVQNPAVKIRMTVRDRLTRWPAPNIRFHLEVNQFHLSCQSPKAHCEREVSTDAAGLIEYQFVPTPESSSEGTLGMLLYPSH
jgi:hypothetical protein